MAVVVVHFGAPEEATRLLAQFPGTEGFLLVADPERGLYHHFGLRRASLREVAGPRVWLRGALTFWRGFRPARPRGDLHQMSGAFLVRDGTIVAEHRYRDSTDHPEWPAFIASGPAAANPKIHL